VVELRAARFRYLNPSSLRTAYLALPRSSRFNNHAQQDAHEFFEWFRDRLHAISTEGRPPIPSAELDAEILHNPVLRDLLVRSVVFCFSIILFHERSARSQRARMGKAHRTGHQPQVLDD
jgi:hypothetical protein